VLRDQRSIHIHWVPSRFALASMGCGAGRHSHRQMADDGTTTVTEVDKVIHHPRTTDTITKLDLKQEFWSFSGGDYEVKDPSGKAYCTVEGKVFTARDKMHILDPTTKQKICMIQEKFIGDSLNDLDSMQIFTYTPKDAGQKSTESDNGVPVYRFAVVHHKAWQTGNNWGDQYNMYYYVDNEKKETPLFAAFRETWRWSWDSKVNVFKGDQVEKTNGKLDECEIVAKFGMFDKSWFDNIGDGNNRYGLEMTTGLDPILLMCLAVICDAMKEKQNNRQQ